MNKLLEKNIKLNNGLEIPQIGLGTYKLTDENEVLDSIKTALQNGYRHIDTATVYNNHSVVARAIKESGIPREKIFITSKIWNTHHSYGDAKIAIDDILKELELEYIDLILIHWPTKERLECWKAMEEAVEKGKVKSIGISNFQPNHIEELMKVAKIKPTVNQFELHPALQNLEVVEACRKNNIVVESWGTMIRGKCFEIEQIKEIARKYNKNEAQICLKWALQLDYVIIPKSSKPSRVISNLEINDFELTQEDIDLLKTIKQERDGPDPDRFDF